jgi:ribonuclease VapC
VIVVDSSAVEAIMFGEPSAAALLARLLVARIRFGRGMGHGGVLNFGDPFSYALAKRRQAPLLFIGEDFETTDVAVALRPRRS